ncbi:uncharacterized protein LOC127871329 isoform X2 [Dreissena polymorpha]|uniref:RING-type domain-containing protein n=2 Tax=Dreissena polymorpha TaxID=45954 RepID=A0A9D4RSP0_DREPO|nr:uncharacterized protein LOC127871329 isoform X2 [Dreissena polymorpha]XP_052270111.1 uncharacterized protein LOC127871329 isoform X2 [Dreissena polymorpha]XP_052270114.1 uncharacterized protein LOC127871329 isoform X2 [Dreissena polymorpha]XP_052270124.1 uncharacterized protein LOC127871329 isoform X2 [Dreissena polymorpha]KAH3877290.1 hypothetical protein DPMN_001153 [Dreissena polymorpha]
MATGNVWPIPTPCAGNEEPMEVDMQDHHVQTQTGQQDNQEMNIYSRGQGHQPMGHVPQCPLIPASGGHRQTQGVNIYNRNQGHNQIDGNSVQQGNREEQSPDTDGRNIHVQPSNQVPNTTGSNRHSPSTLAAYTEAVDAVIQAEKEEQEQLDLALAISLQEEEISRGHSSRHGRGNQHRGRGRSHGSSGQPGGHMQNSFLAQLLGISSDDELPRNMQSNPSSSGLLDMREERAAFQDEHRQDRDEMQAIGQDLQRQAANVMLQHQIDTNRFLRRSVQERERQMQAIQGRRLQRMFGPGMINMAQSNYEGLLDLQERIGAVSTGLSNEDCSRLPTKTYKKVGDTNCACSICFEDYQTGDKQTTLTCLHVYHSCCIEPWLKERATCPVCRQEVKVS